MIILAIDPGTKCGWAVRRGDGRILESGTWDLSTRRFEGGGMRFLRLRAFFQAALNLAKPDMVAFEEVRGHKGTDAAHIYGGVIATITEECEARGIPYQGIPVATIKRHATGKGNADKAAMILAAQEKWPGWCGDDNEADARWIAETAVYELGAREAA
ncbi:MAG: crossover junction endodeoxyribonuclease RuvC [Desulfovibrionaceae bacterium]|nr:crossover junction endodeoxyribonuclease RuvC [Desulfovibrionaceae bacterium]